ncbi:MAG: iron uptake porin [Kaiparowitsia implicata GSE-PSE-MK54-09C]|jgi:hypothetical protein|nr:iron uptake porin [Kaiparowitsia implicata GSE-PSE-MK54-09C]
MAQALTLAEADVVSSDATRLLSEADAESLEGLTIAPVRPEGESTRTEPLSLSTITLDSIDPQLAEVSDPTFRPLLGQVTSVTQLSDVQPTDWAYEALRLLVEEYDCLEGYPDGTFRGDRPMTRYEFAAGLAACLDALPQTEPGLDLLALEQLQTEFSDELALLRSRVDLLEDQVATLNAQQFSTTTVLQANVWFNLTQAFTSGPVLAERNLATPGGTIFAPTRDANNVPTIVERSSPQATLSVYANFNFNTSFTGRDALVAQLAFGTGNSPANELVSSGFFNSWGVPFTDQGSLIGNAPRVLVRELFYSFPVGNNLQLDVGPRLNVYRYFDGNRYTFFQTGASSFNASGSTLFSTIDRGAGAVARVGLGSNFNLALAYLAESTEFLDAPFFNTAENPNDGFFGPTNMLIGQLSYSPDPNLNLRLLYAYSNIKPYNGFIGGAVGEPLPYGFADDGFGGNLNTASANTILANFDWTFADWVGLFGRYSYGDVNIDPVDAARAGGNVRVQSFQVGLGFPDLGKPGALGVVSFLIPHDYLGGREFLLSGGGDGGTQYELEVSYRYPVNANVSLVPAFYAIWNANNFESNPTVYVGNMRLQFGF